MGKTEYKICVKPWRSTLKQHKEMGCRCLLSMNETDTSKFCFRLTQGILCGLQMIRDHPTTADVPCPVFEAMHLLYAHAAYRMCRCRISTRAWWIDFASPNLNTCVWRRRSKKSSIFRPRT